MELLPLQPASNQRKLWMGASVGLHGALLLLLLARPQPVFLKPSALMKGDNGKSMALVYLAPAKAAAEEPKVAQTAQKHPLQLPKRPTPRPKPQRPTSDRDTLARNYSPKMGPPRGADYYCAASGHDVRPALPIVSPDPPVAAADLQGAEGDVIIEVTIDIVGNVVQTKLLQGIGHGIEDKVIPVVQRWKFKPATFDGVPIASRQDVHFHYPA